MAQLKKNPPIIFDYKDVKTLQRYINVYGQIEPISKTGLSEKQQRSCLAQKPNWRNTVASEKIRAIL